MTEPFYAPRFEILLAGVTLAADLTEQVVSLAVETDLDLAGTFSLTVRNPDNRLLDSALLDIGKNVEIHLGYGPDLSPAFLGEIASVEPTFPTDGGPVIQVTGYDKSYRLRRNRPEPTTHSSTTDALIAAQIAVENGLIPMVDPTPALPDDIPQNESDFAFLKSRAEQYQYDVYVEWDRLHFQFPRPQFAARVLEWGRNLSSFSARISGAGLAGLQVVRGYSQELAQAVYAAALAADLDTDNLMERLGSTATDLLGSLVSEGIQKHTVSNPLQAADLAKSLLTNLLEGMYEGEGACVGLPDLTAGAYIEVRGVGKRFSGTYRVRKVIHRLDSSGLRTDFAITQRGHSSLIGLLRDQAVETPPPDQAEKFYGLRIGEVVDNYEMGDHQAPLGRVKVAIKENSARQVTSWAPCVRPAAGSGSGLYALPDKGDQVVVAFRNGDFGQPYVLGSLWNATNAPPEHNSDNHNSRRVIVTPAGHTIAFDDSPNAKSLTVRDAKGSEIIMDSTTGALSVKASGDLTISATGSITISAKDDLHLNASSGTTKLDMTSDGVDIT